MCHHSLGHSSAQNLTRVLGMFLVCSCSQNHKDSRQILLLAGCWSVFGEPHSCPSKQSMAAKCVHLLLFVPVPVEQLCSPQGKGHVQLHSEPKCPTAPLLHFEKDLELLHPCRSIVVLFHELLWSWPHTKRHQLAKARLKLPSLQSQRRKAAAICRPKCHDHVPKSNLAACPPQPKSRLVQEDEVELPPHSSHLWSCCPR